MIEHQDIEYLQSQTNIGKVNALHQHVYLQPHERGKTKAPFYLPITDFPHFTGREKELEQLEKVLLLNGDASSTRRSAVSGISGPGGIGKTALAYYFAQKNKENFPDGVIAIRVDGKSNDYIVRELAEIMEFDLALDSRLEPHVVIQRIFSKRKALLIFDNADSSNLKTVILRNANCAVIITTRDRQLPALLNVNKAEHINLVELPTQDALLLLKKYTGEERIGEAPEIAEYITELVGCLPLALEIAGRQIEFNESRTITDFAELLEDEKERLKELEIENDEDLNVRASLELSYKNLDEQQREFFACLSVCAEEGFSKRAAAAASGVTEFNKEHMRGAEKILGHLHRYSLLNRMAALDSRYVFHPLIRLFAASKLNVLETVEKKNKTKAGDAHSNFFIKMLRKDNLKKDELENFLREELPDILTAAKWAVAQNFTDYKIMFFLSPVLQRLGHWKKGLQLMGLVRELAEKENHWQGAVQLRIQEAKFYLFLCMNTCAENVLLPIEGLLKKINNHETKTRDEAVYLNMIGVVHQKQGKLGQAKNDFKKSLRLEEELGNKHGQAKVLNSLGVLHERLEDLHEAIRYYDESYELLILAGDLRGQAMVLNSLGSILQRIGELAEAEMKFRESARLEEKQCNRRGLAMVLNSLGRVLQKQRKLDEAQQEFQKSMDIRKEIGDLQGQAICLNSLGILFDKMKKFNDSHMAFEQSIKIGKKINDKRHLSMVLNAYGSSLAYQRRSEEAIRRLTEAFEYKVELNDRRGIIICIPTLVRSLCYTHQHDRAQEYLDRALKIVPKNKKLLETKKRFFG